MSDDKRHFFGKLTGSGVILFGLPLATGLAASAFGIPTDKIIEIVTNLGVVPAILVVGAIWAGNYVVRQGEESRRREEKDREEARARESRMADRLDKVEDRYHTDMVALSSRCIESIDKNTAAFQDLHQTVTDQHAQTVLLLTKNLRDGSMSVMTPLVGQGEVEAVTEAMIKPKKGPGE